MRKELIVPLHVPALLMVIQHAIIESQRTFLKHGQLLISVDDLLKIRSVVLEVLFFLGFEPLKSRTIQILAEGLIFFGRNVPLFGEAFIIEFDLTFKISICYFLRILKITDDLVHLIVLKEPHEFSIKYGRSFSSVFSAFIWTAVHLIYADQAQSQLIC